MSAANFLTWSGQSSTGQDPRRPSTDDLGGDQKQDDNESPPDDVEHFTAAGWNQLVRQVAALSKMVGACKLEIQFNAGAPFIAAVSSPNPDISASTFSVVDDFLGGTTISWPAATFPPHVCAPTGLTLLESVTDPGAYVVPLVNGVSVRTLDGGSLSDIPFSIEIN